MLFVDAIFLFCLNGVVLFASCQKQETRYVN